VPLSKAPPAPYTITPTCSVARPHTLLVGTHIRAVKMARPNMCRWARLSSYTMQLHVQQWILTHAICCVLQHMACCSHVVVQGARPVHRPPSLAVCCNRCGPCLIMNVLHRQPSIRGSAPLGRTTVWARLLCHDRDIGTMLYSMKPWSGKKGIGPYTSRTLSMSTRQGLLALLYTSKTP
jgi:hypothetical protein